MQRSLLRIAPLAFLVGILPLGACSSESSSPAETSPGGKGGGGGQGGAQAGASSGKAGQAGSSQAGSSQAGSAGSGGGGGGSAGKGGSAGAASGAGGQAGAQAGCGSEADCALPETLNPKGCAEAACEAGKCVYRARDKDGDGKRSKFCKDTSGNISVEIGNDCDDSDPSKLPGAWDGPEGEGNGASCDGVDNDCSGTADDNVLSDGTSCACKPGSVAQCSEDSSGKKIDWPTGEPKGECKYGSKTCVVDASTGAGQWGPCTDAIAPVTEECNGGKDDDCDGQADDADPDVSNAKSWYCDGDNDGFAAAGVQPTVACEAPTDGCSGPAPVWKLNLPPSDCDDSRPDVSPNGVEVCDTDSADENCNGEKNEGCGCTNGQTQSCFVDPNNNPIPHAGDAAIGSCKAGSQTCNNGAWGPCLNGQGPIQDICANQGTDDDCDGDVSDADDPKSWYCDGDNDGFAAVGASPVVACEAPADGCSGPAPVWKTNLPATDCDDSRPDVNPNGVEACDPGSADENCNGEKNEGCGCTNGAIQTCFTDPSGNPIPSASGKAIGECKAGSQTCTGGQWGPCTGGKGPAQELCANLGKDNDCDGKTDDADDPKSWYCDGDNDGFAAVGVQPTVACNAPGNGCVGPSPIWKQNLPATDCDDSRADINPNGAEACDVSKADEDCDGQKNEGCTCTNGDTQPCFTDPSGSLIPHSGNTPIGECKAGVQTCSGGQWGSCLNGKGPAQELCANLGKDNDCDGKADDADDPKDWWCDGDNDGFAAVGATPTPSCNAPGSGCAGPNPVWKLNIPATDCNDSRPDVNKNAAEVCDAGKADEDCDGQINEGCTCDNGSTQKCYTDPSGNPIPNNNGVPVGACKAGTQTCTNGQWGSCLDGQGPSVEICNGVDDNCNGSVDDGAPPSSQTCTVGTGQCVRSGPLTCVNGTYQCAVSPGAPQAEACNGVDDDCDGILDDGTFFSSNNVPNAACYACLNHNALTVYAEDQYKGDKEFGGHGPIALMKVSSFVSSIAVDYVVQETSGDYTTGYGFAITGVQVPAGRTLDHLIPFTLTGSLSSVPSYTASLPSGNSGYAYIYQDSNTSVDSGTGSMQLLWSGAGYPSSRPFTYSCMGDTSGEDINTGDGSEAYCTLNLGCFWAQLKP